MTQKSAVFKRVATAVVGLPAVIYLVHVGGLPLLIVCGALALVGLREFYIAFAGEDRLIHGVGYFFTAAYFAAIYFFGPGYWLLIALTGFIISVQTGLVVFYKKLPFRECVSVVYGFLYVPFMLSFIILVREHYLGQYYVWLILTAAFGCDTFAYLTGTAIGRRKLTGSPSPSKSAEGLAGGIIGGALAGFVFGLLMTRFSDPGDNFIIIATLISLTGAVFSVIGDMAASAVKRFCEIKDFGNVFPGHGGVLDRTDSIIMVAPIVFALITLIGVLPI